jgi:ribosomal protein L37E
MNKRARYHAIALTMALIGPDLMLRGASKPKLKCRRDGCNNLTYHNKGYCSAACFKASKKVIDL